MRHRVLLGGLLTLRDTVEGSDGGRCEVDRWGFFCLFLERRKILHDASLLMVSFKHTVVCGSHLKMSIWIG